MPGTGLGVRGTKVNNTDAVPTAMELHFAEHFRIYHPHTKPGRQKGHHHCSHILDG